MAYFEDAIKCLNVTVSAIESTIINKELHDTLKDVPGNYALVYVMTSTLRNLGLPIGKTLPQILELFSRPVNKIRLPAKISDLTGKVEKKVEGAKKKDRQNILCTCLTTTGNLPSTSIDYLQNANIHGINEQYLQKCNSKRSVPIIGPISYKVVFELYRYMKDKNETWSNMCAWIQGIYGLNFKLHTGNVRRSVDIIIKCRANLIRTRKPVEAFMDCVYVPPKQSIKVSKPHTRNNLIQTNEKLQSVLSRSCMNTRNSSIQCETGKERIKILEKENDNLNEKLNAKEIECDILTSDLNEAECEISDISFNTDELIEKMQEEESDRKKYQTEYQELRVRYQKVVKKQTQMLEKLCKYEPKTVERHEQRQNQKIEIMEEELKQYKKQNIKMNELKQEKVKYMQKYYYSNKVVTDLVEKKEAMNTEVTKLQQLQKVHQITISDLNSQINSIKDKQISLRKDNSKTFKDSVSKCCMSLLKLGVSSRKVGDTIKVVLNDIAGLEVEDNQLPEKTFVNRLSGTMSVLSKMQVAEELLESDNCTLQLDGTSRYGNHSMTYDISFAKNNTKTLGMMDVVTENSETLLTCTKTIFDDLAELISNNSEEKVTNFNTMISRIKNTMTDRCSVNKAFLKDFEKFRSDILPFAIENFDKLEQSEKENLIKVHDFYCGYHITLGWSDVSDKALSIFENIAHADLVNIVQWKSSNSTVYSAVRAISQLLQVRGHAAASRAADFNAFLFHNGGEVNRLIPFKGNRFGLLFKNAAMVMYHFEHIISFLVDIHQDNQLIKAVHAYIHNATIVSGIRALACIYCCIVGPFISLLESNKSAHAMTAYYQQMDTKMQDWCDDASSVLDGSAILFQDFPSKKDVVYDKVFTVSNDVPEDVQEGIELILINMVLVNKRQLLDHLDGGKYASPSDTIVKEGHSVPCSNISTEHNFGQWDYLSKLKPNASLVAIESIILFRNNETNKWISSKLPTDQSRVLQKAKSSVNLFRNKWKIRKQQIMEERVKKQANSRQAKAEKQLKKSGSKLKFIEKVIAYGGLCHTVLDLDKILNGKSKSKQKDILLAHLRYYQHVVEVPVDKSLFQFSNKVDGSFTVPKLKANLSTVIQIVNKPNTVTDGDDVENDLDALPPPSKVRRLSASARKELFEKEKSKLMTSLETSCSKNKPSVDVNTINIGNEIQQVTATNQQPDIGVTRNVFDLFMKHI